MASRGGMRTLVYRQSGQHHVCMPWFTQEGKLVYTCPGLHRKANHFAHALVYTGRQTALHMPWFIQEGELVYTGRQTGLHMHWFTQEGKLVYVHVVHRSANWVTQKTCITDTHALAELSVSCHMAWEEDCAALFLKQAFLWQCPPSFR